MGICSSAGAASPASPADGALTGAERSAQVLKDIVKWHGPHKCLICIPENIQSSITEIRIGAVDEPSDSDWIYQGGPNCAGINITLPPEQGEPRESDQIMTFVKDVESGKWKVRAHDVKFRIETSRPMHTEDRIFKIPIYGALRVFETPKYGRNKGWDLDYEDIIMCRVATTEKPYHYKGPRIFFHLLKELPYKWNYEYGETKNDYMCTIFMPHESYFKKIRIGDGNIALLDGCEKAPYIYDGGERCLGIAIKLPRGEKFRTRFPKVIELKECDTGNRKNCWKTKPEVIGIDWIDENAVIQKCVTSKTLRMNVPTGTREEIQIRYQDRLKMKFNTIKPKQNEEDSITSMRCERNVYFQIVETPAEFKASETALTANPVKTRGMLIQHPKRFAALSYTPRAARKKRYKSSRDPLEVIGEA